MKILKKSEWFSFDSPIGEPEIVWKYDYDYCIERIQREDGEIVWFGDGVNWTKNPNEKHWRILSVDESVQPNEDGIYPEERLVFIPCETPIYEIEYEKSKLR